MLARVPCSLQPPGRPIVRSSSHASRMCLNRDVLSFPCRALFVRGRRLEIRTPCEGTGASCTYSTALPQLQCGSAPCPFSTAIAAAGMRLSVCRTDRCEVGSHCRSTSRRLVRKFQTARSPPCAGAKPAGSVERSSKPCFLASLPCKTSLKCSVLVC